MADFTDKLSLGTSRMNPSSMVPGASGNAPQAGLGTQLKNALSSVQPQVANQATGRDLALPSSADSQRMALMRQLNQVPSPMKQLSQVPSPMGLSAELSTLPPKVQKMLPSENVKEKPVQPKAKSKMQRPVDFNMLANVFKALGSNEEEY